MFVYKNTRTGQIVESTEPRPRLERLAVWQVVASGGDRPGGDLSSLASLTRDELNEMAAERGITDPGKLPNKDAVIDAIEAAEAS